MYNHGMICDINENSHWSEVVNVFFFPAQILLDFAKRMKH